MNGDEALRQRAIVVAIQDAIGNAGIRDLKVAVSGNVITLTGSTCDEALCEHASAIARRIAPEMTCVNMLVVHEQ